MKVPNISSHMELRLHIQKMESEKERRAALVVKDVKEVYEVITHPAKIIKQTAAELAGNKDFRSDLLKIVVNLASNFLSRKVTSSAVSALLTLLIDKVGERNKNSGSGNIISQLINFISGRGSGQAQYKKAES